VSKAKYYLYRNLHTGGFSIKQKGLVCARGHVVTMKNVEFKVNAAGSAKAKKEQQRNVHAYMVADNFEVCKVLASGLENLLKTVDDMLEITYHPYSDDKFVVKSTNEPIEFAQYAIAVNGKVYIRK